MGKKIDTIKEKSEKAKDSFARGRELGVKAEQGAKKIKEILDSLPQDVDDEIAQAVSVAEQGASSDAKNYMNTEVKSTIETGKKTMDAANSEAGKQIENNADTKNKFSQMDSAGSFGKAARDTGRAKIDSSTKEFRSAVAQNESATDKADEDFSKKLSSISDTF